MAMGTSTGMMEPATSDSSDKTTSKAMASTLGRTGGIMMVNGLAIKCMEVESSGGPMDARMRVSLPTIVKRAMAFSCGKMEGSTMDRGRMASKTALATSQMKMEA